MRSGNGYPVGWGFPTSGGVGSPVTSGSISTVTSTTAQPVSAPANATVTDDSASLTVVPAGSTIKVDAQNLGLQPGRVSIVVGNLAFPGAIANWSDGAVNITLPQVEVTGPVRAKIVVRRADGSVANETPFELAATTH
jgi:hypothetical protein